MRTHLAALLALLLGASTLPAQVGGRVVGSSGRPLAGATVELWAPLRQLARARTDSAGGFRFAAGESAGATALRVHLLGYAAASLALDGAAPELRLRLQPEPLVLAGVTGTARRRRSCPSREDPRAHALWEQARARYQVPPALPAVRLVTEQFVDRVPFDRIGRTDGLRPDSAEFRNDRQVGDDLLYGTYARRRVVGEVVGWEYAPLAWGFNQHFVRPSFGAAHTLSVVSATGDATVLRFCPRNTREASIEGTLTLGADTTLRSARWRYRVSRPDAEAGGEVDYLPPSATTRRLLFADRGLFWRRLPGGHAYYFRLDRYRRWEIQEPR